MAASSSSTVNQTEIRVVRTENVPMQVITLRLTKDNYFSWSPAMTMGIAGHERMAYIDGSNPEPTKTSGVWHTSFLEDNQMKTWIVNSVLVEIQPLILRKKTTRDMWVILEQMYGQKKTAIRTYQIMKAVYGLRQGNSSIAYYYGALKTKWEELDYHSNIPWHCPQDQALHVAKEWENRVFLFLVGLNDEFEGVRSQILNSGEVSSIENVYSCIEAKEQRRLVTTEGKRDLMPYHERSALVSHGPGGTTRSLRRCTHCKKTGHTVDYCWDLHLEKKGYKGRSSIGKTPVSEVTKPSGEKLFISADQIRELRAYLGRIDVNQVRSGQGLDPDPTFTQKRRTKVVQAVAGPAAAAAAEGELPPPLALSLSSPFFFSSLLCSFSLLRQHPFAAQFPPLPLCHYSLLVPADPSSPYPGHIPSTLSSKLEEFWRVLPRVESIGDERPVGCGYVFGRHPVFATGLACSERRWCKAPGVECSTAAAGEMDPYYHGPPRGLSLGRRPPMVCTCLCLHPQMEYQCRGKKRVEPSTEAQKEPSPAHSDAHTSHDDSTSGQQNAQASVGAQTPPRQTPPVDQQALLLTTLQTLTSLVQSMAGIQRSQASPTGDTTTPPKENATTVSFQQFMSMQPPVFTGDGSPNKAEEWIKEVEHIFEVLERNHLSLEEYVAKYRHLEAYCPHLYTTAEVRANKFIYGLRDGLRGRVMSSSPHNLDEAVTMARRMEEDWARTQRDHQNKTSQHTQGGCMPVKRQHPTGRTRPYERRDDRTFRRNRPGRSETTQGSVASPTSLRCLTCSCAHPWKPCYRVTGACLHCGVQRRGGRRWCRRSLDRQRRSGGGDGNSRGYPGHVPSTLSSKIEEFWRVCESATDERPVKCGYVFGRRLAFATGLACSERRRCKAPGYCCAWSVGSHLSNLGVLGKAEYLSLEFTHSGLSALPLQRMKWIHTVMGHHGGCLSVVGRPWKAEPLTVVDVPEKEEGWDTGIEKEGHRLFGQVYSRQGAQIEENTVNRQIGEGDLAVWLLACLDQLVCHQLALDAQGGHGHGTTYSARVRGIGRGIGGRGRFQCTYCGKIGHLEDRCWDKHGRSSSLSQERNMVTKQGKSPTHSSMGSAQAAAPTVEDSSSSIAPETVTASIDKVEYEKFLAHKASQASASTALTDRAFSVGPSTSDSGFRILHWSTLGGRTLLMVDYHTPIRM
ncbi:hypothetical protein EJ110_NYTH14143 [Nymphaea thermarum]|nr:hypothetical protein EJ110_NYTH14143 [Nymphaea thermarum]